MLQGKEILRLYKSLRVLYSLLTGEKEQAMLMKEATVA
jgi:hypothetical protein